MHQPDRQYMKIELEINQQKPFKNNYQKASVNIMFTASWLSKKQSDAIKPFDLTIQQYNILRILRGMQGEPATVKLLTERMIDKMSNASRLVDKLLAKNYVRREECREDRRRVDIFITDKGLDILDKASEALDHLFSDKNQKMMPDEASMLSDLLDKLRD
jgi:DNA-binding MarR family transcriptional regulator